MKTFALPGPLIMGIIFAPLFGFYIGTFVSSILSPIGAGALYLIAKYFGKHYIEKKFPFKVKYFKDKVEENKDSLFWYLCFVR